MVLGEHKVSEAWKTELSIQKREEITDIKYPENSQQLSARRPRMTWLSTGWPDWAQVYLSDRIGPRAGERSWEGGRAKEGSSFPIRQNRISGDMCWSILWWRVMVSATYLPNNNQNKEVNRRKYTSVQKQRMQVSQNVATGWISVKVI